MPSFVIANDNHALADTLCEQLSSDTEFYVLMPCSAEFLSKHLTAPPQADTSTSRSALSMVLTELRVPVHKAGYRQLLTAIPLFARDPRQSLSKELYPAVAEALGYSDWKTIEYSIRRAISGAWSHRDPAAWKKYFPSDKKAPSNKVFISAMLPFTD